MLFTCSSINSRGGCRTLIASLWECQPGREETARIKSGRRFALEYHCGTLLGQLDSFGSACLSSGPVPPLPEPVVTDGQGLRAPTPEQDSPRTWRATPGTACRRGARTVGQLAASGDVHARPWGPSRRRNGRGLPPRPAPSTRSPCRRAREPGSSGVPAGAARPTRLGPPGTPARRPGPRRSTCSWSTAVRGQSARIIIPDHVSHRGQAPQRRINRP